MLSFAVKSRYGNKRPISKFFLTRLHFIETRSMYKENRQGNAENRLKIPTDLHPSGLIGKKSITHLRMSAQETVLNTFSMSQKLYFYFFYLYVHLYSNE